VPWQPGAITIITKAFCPLIQIESGLMSRGADVDTGIWRPHHFGWLVMLLACVVHKNGDPNQALLLLAILSWSLGTRVFTQWPGIVCMCRRESNEGTPPGHLVVVTVAGRCRVVLEQPQLFSFLIGFGKVFTPKISPSNIRVYSAFIFGNEYYLSKWFYCLRMQASLRFVRALLRSTNRLVVRHGSPESLKK